jgi:hypothetical protein
MLKNDFKRQHHMQTGKDKKLRDQVERLTGTDPQFINVWGGTTGSLDVRSRWAKTKCCYLCKGPLVTVENGTSPEMEHKLPSLEFYTKVHNINEKYPELLQLWQKYVDNNVKKIQTLYHDINCGDNWKRDVMTNPLTTINSLIDKALEKFVTSINNRPDYDKFIALLKVYLMEFAYAHHTCNQLKENDNLSTAKAREVYLKNINAACTNGKFLSKPLLKESKLRHEIQSISSDLTDRNPIIGGHMTLLNEYIGQYALFLVAGFTQEEHDKYKTSKRIQEYCLKKMMVQSIKDTVDFIITTKNNEKRVNKMKLSASRQNQKNAAENEEFAAYAPILRALNELSELKSEYNEITNVRQKTNFTKSTDPDNLYNLTVNKIRTFAYPYNDGIVRAILNRQDGELIDDIKIIKGMDPNLMYSNLLNSELGGQLNRVYREGYGGDNQTSLSNHFASGNEKDEGYRAVEMTTSDVQPISISQQQQIPTPNQSELVPAIGIFTTPTQEQLVEKSNEWDISQRNKFHSNIKRVRDPPNGGGGTRKRGRRRARKRTHRKPVQRKRMRRTRRKAVRNNNNNNKRTRTRTRTRNNNNKRTRTRGGTWSNTPVTSLEQ